MKKKNEKIEKKSRKEGKKKKPTISTTTSQFVFQAIKQKNTFPFVEQKWWPKTRERYLLGVSAAPLAFLLSRRAPRVSQRCPDLLISADSNTKKKMAASPWPRPFPLSLQTSY